MSKKSKTVKIPKQIYPQTNLSRAYYKQLIDSIEHAPLVRHTTLVVASMVIAVSILLGTLIWYAQFNPGNLHQTNAEVTIVSSDKKHTSDSTDTFVTFVFTTTDNQLKTVRQPATQRHSYSVGQSVKIGYHPKNPNYARILDKTELPTSTTILWSLPFVVMLWFIFVALIRYIKRQEIIWQAAEAADID